MCYKKRSLSLAVQDLRCTSLLESTRRRCFLFKKEPRFFLSSFLKTKKRSFFLWVGLLETARHPASLAPTVTKKAYFAGAFLSPPTYYGSKSVSSPIGKLIPIFSVTYS